MGVDCEAHLGEDSSPWLALLAGEDVVEPELVLDEELSRSILNKD